MQKISIEIGIMLYKNRNSLIVFLIKFSLSSGIEIIFDNLISSALSNLAYLKAKDQSNFMGKE